MRRARCASVRARRELEVLMNKEKALVGPEQVTQRLIDLYGPDRVWQVEQLGKHIFRAWLTTGGVVLVTVLEGGLMAFRPLEEGA